MEPDATSGQFSKGSEIEPDARFSFANERTFLAWMRTALALIVAGVAVAQFADFGALLRGTIAVFIIGGGSVLAFAGYRRWKLADRALRTGEPVPRSDIPAYIGVGLAIAGFVFAVAVAITLL